MPRCITLVGYPGVGKSTFAKTYVQDGWRVISVDQAVKDTLAAHGKTHDDDWRPYTEEIAHMVDQWLQDAITKGHNIVFDALNTTIARRARHLNFIKQQNPDYRFEAVIIHPPEEDEHALRLVRRAFLERRAEIKEGLSDFYFRDLAKKFQPPTAAEGYSKISEVGVPPQRPLIGM